jgi:hypothetical protein
LTRDMLKLLPSKDVPQQWRQERAATPAVSDEAVLGLHCVCMFVCWCDAVLH